MPENLCVFLPYQKAERRRPFGTGLVGHCPQGLFSPFFSFLRAIFSRPFRLSPAPAICPWVSEDEYPQNPSLCQIRQAITQSNIFAAQEFQNYRETREVTTEACRFLTFSLVVLCFRCLSRESDRLKFDLRFSTLIFSRIQARNRKRRLS